MAPMVEIPDEFKSIVRRTQKLLLKKPSSVLAESANRFMSALNAGQTGDELSELGDELEDTYHDCR